MYIENKYQCLVGFLPSTYIFLDALGTFITAPYNSFVILTWQPSRLVEVKPNGGRELYSLCSRITWQVEHAKLASHAPSKLISCSWA